MLGQMLKGLPCNFVVMKPIYYATALEDCTKPPLNKAFSDIWWWIRLGKYNCTFVIWNGEKKLVVSSGLEWMVAMIKWDYHQWQIATIWTWDIHGQMVVLPKACRISNHTKLISNSLRPRQNCCLFCRRHFQTHFLQLKYLNFDYNFTEVRS